MGFDELFKHPAIPVLTFFLGLFLGNRQALWLARRKEFNDLAEPVRIWLHSQISCPSAYGQCPSDYTIYCLAERMGRWRRYRFKAAWLRGEESRKHDTRQDSFGQLFLTDPAKVQAAALDCLRLLGTR